MPGQVSVRDGLDDTPGVVSSAAKKYKAKIEPLTVTATEAGDVTLGLQTTKAGTKILKRKPKLKVTLLITFTPTGGTPNSQTTKATLKVKKKN